MKAEHPSGKFKAAKPIATAVGPIRTANDPAKFGNKGQRSGKDPANGIVPEAKGPTFTANETHIPSTDANKPAKEKELTSKKWFDPHETNDTAGEKTDSQSGSGGPTDRPYDLKKEYRK